MRVQNPRPFPGSVRMAVGGEIRQAPPDCPRGSGVLAHGVPARAGKGEDNRILGRLAKVRFDTGGTTRQGAVEETTPVQIEPRAGILQKRGVLKAPSFFLR